MAKRIPGEFVPADVNLANDPKILTAGYRAELLFRRANEYAKRMDRDGIIHAVELPIIAHGIPGKPDEFADALVRVGLWKVTDDGWCICSFLKWNMSQAEQEEARNARRVGAAKTNHKKGQHADAPDAECPLCAAESEAA